MRITLKEHRGKTAPGFKHDARLKTDVHKRRKKRKFALFSLSDKFRRQIHHRKALGLTDKWGIQDKEPSCCVFIIRSSFTARFESEQQPPTACWWPSSPRNKASCTGTLVFSAGVCVRVPHLTVAAAHSSSSLLRALLVWTALLLLLLLLLLSVDNFQTLCKNSRERTARGGAYMCCFQGHFVGS